MAAVAFSDLLDRFGGSPARANSAVNAQREGWAKDPALAGMRPEDLAEFDRFSHGAQFGQGFPSALAPMAVPIAGVGGSLNELSKLSPAAMEAIARITGDASFLPSGSTSAPSFRNVLQLMKGAFEGSVYRR